MKLARFVLMLAPAFAAAAAPAPLPVAVPMEITAQYVVTANGGITIGRATESYQRKGDSYTIQSVTRSDGPLKVFIDDQFTVESSGRVLKSGLQPLEYNERRAKDNKRDLKSTFDWDRGVMHTMLRGEPSDTTLPAATQDRISIMYQFAHMQSYGETIVIPMADRRKIEPFTYKLVEEGTVKTPAGDFQARHYRRVVDNPKDTKVDVWLAKDRFNFPVRVIFDDPKGFVLEQSLVDLQVK